MPTVPGSSAGRRTLALGIALAVAVVFGAVLATILTADGVPPPAPQATGERQLEPLSGETADPLPDLELEALFADDDRIALADYRGTPLVVNYWATWCAPCVAEMPDLERISRELAGRAAFVGINVRDDVDDARAFAEELGISYDLARDPAGEAFAAVGGFGMPTTLFVDVEGVVVYRHTGILEGPTLRSLLARHLGVAQAWRTMDGLAGLSGAG